MDKLPKTRICTQCEKEKVLTTEFGKQSNGKYGRQSACLVCTRRILTEYRKTPKGKAKYQEYARRHREKPSYREKHQAYRDTPKAQWRIYMGGAKKRGLAFEFTLEEFTERFWQQPCAYCGEPLRRVGVDRVDNTKGYTKENTVSCCSTCNFMKLRSSRDDFITKCVQVAIHAGGLASTPPASLHRSDQPLLGR